MTSSHKFEFNKKSLQVPVTSLQLVLMMVFCTDKSFFQIGLHMSTLQLQENKKRKNKADSLLN